ncbi:hypothetical protein BJ878DRAFT_489077 [Calycina marina]|uniref:Uncharacterized protein n=1 Tax=Calycina marina TaxID=1763456 RepID=A0A9P8CIE5_9HELO|nr:hypothetical protein BJ878DRAFT_489077 [Calycina marina]
MYNFSILIDRGRLQEAWRRAWRYALTKLVEECAVRQFVALCPVKEMGMTVNMVAPSLCSTCLGKDSRRSSRSRMESCEP